MSSEWFYAKGNEKHGPFSTAEIKRLASAGQLSKHDLVSKSGAADWVRASKVKGLFPEEAPEPPQPPKAAEPEAKEAAAGEVTTAAHALLSALTRRAKRATHKALESASQYTSKAQANLQDFQKQEPKERLAQMSATTETLARQLVATGVEKIKQASVKSTGKKRLMMLGCAGAAIATFLLLAAGYRSQMWDNGRSSTSGRGKAAAAAKKALLETAEKVDGPFIAVVKDIVDAVESGDQPFSVADSRMYDFGPDSYQFAPETRSAYQRWRAAKLAEE